MLNNKGFAVSSALYTLLIAFLLFLGAALAQFTSSIGLLNKANEDLINGVDFKAQQRNPNGACTGGIGWYQEKDEDGNIKASNTIVLIKTRYGTKYWPKDFETSEHRQAKLSNDGNIDAGEYTSYDGKIIVNVKTDPENINNPGFNEAKFFISIKDVKTVTYATYPEKNVIEIGGAPYMGIFDQCQK